MRKWYGSAHLFALAALLLPVVAACTGPTAPSAPSPGPTSAPAKTQATSVPAAAPPAAPKPAAAGGTFAIASLGPLPKTLHPYPDAASYDSSWSQAARIIWSGGLLEQDATTFEYRGDMASEWIVSPDGRTFTFKLKDGLKWSDGQPITVDDFLFAWDNASKPENDFVGLDDLERIEAFTAPDARTIVVKLTETLATDVAISVAAGVGPVPKHVWQGKPWNDPVANPEILRPSVVLGPFTLRDWNSAEGATFERLPGWYKGQAKFERIVIRPGQQPTVAYELIKSNQAQWAPDIPPSQYQEAKQNASINLIEWTAANSSYRALEFNLQRDLFKDKRVREALSRAVNRQDVIQVAENNLGQPQFSFLNPQNTKWNNPNVERYDFNLERAKQLLQEAGYRTDGGRLIGPSGQPVKLDVLFPTTSNPRRNIATYLQQQYKLLGIEVEVRGLDFNAYTDETHKKRNFDISLASWGGGSIDPDLGPKGQLISTGQQNVTGLKSERVDDLFKRGAVELDEAKRKEIYNELQRVIADELPSFYLYSLTSFSPMSKQITGVQPNKLDRLDYNDGLARWAFAQ